jgi:hypothetical protein
MTGEAMAEPQCPICFTPLEVREVTPCTICGGWPSSVESFDPSREYYEWRLPNGSTLVLCNGCMIEEFMVPRGLGEKLGLPKSRRLLIDGLVRVRRIAEPALTNDKFCPECGFRLGFLRLLASASETDDAIVPEN